MRVGILYETIGLNGSYDRLFDQVEELDRLGFDSVWIRDRQLDQGALGSPAILLAALAGCTSRLRLGSFTTPTLYHPARVAEDFAVVDMASGGRLNFGAFAGASEDTFRAYGVPYAERLERFREALEIITAAWCLDQFSYGGRHYRFPSHLQPNRGLIYRPIRSAGEPYVPQWERGPETPDLLTVTPKPLQEPRPPIWILAEDDGSVVFAAEHGYSLAVAGDEEKELAAAVTRFEDELRKARRHRAEVEVGVIAELPLDGDRPAPAARDRLLRMQEAVTPNHLMLRAPYPKVGHEAATALFRYLASEVQPMLQA